jgi:hypothetical protein
MIQSRKLRQGLALASTIPYRIRRSRAKIAHHFIHIPKNGGSAMRDALRWRGDVSLSEKRHLRYIDIADTVGRQLKFVAVVRNPWSRTASRFWYGKTQMGNWDADDPRRQYIQDASFEQYVRDQKIFEIPAFPGQPWMGPLSSWCNQLHWISDENGKVACNCLRFEHLNKDLNAYFRSWIVLPLRNVSRNSYDYRTMYTDELAEIVADTFREDIDHFGFSFDGAATRNVLCVP